MTTPERDIYTPTLRLKTTLGELGKNIEAVVAENRSLRSLADSRYRTIGELQGRLDTARRSFGEAFVKGQHAPTGEKRPNRRKLSPREAKDIRQAHAGGMKQADLARNYGVNPSTISRLLQGIYY